jgi:hypothetical protein
VPEPSCTTPSELVNVQPTPCTTITVEDSAIPEEIGVLVEFGSDKGNGGNALAEDDFLGVLVNNVPFEFVPRIEQIIAIIDQEPDFLNLTLLDENDNGYGIPLNYDIQESDTPNRTPSVIELSPPSGSLAVTGEIGTLIQLDIVGQIEDLDNNLATVRINGRNIPFFLDPFSLDEEKPKFTFQTSVFLPTAEPLVVTLQAIDSQGKFVERTLNYTLE